MTVLEQCWSKPDRSLFRPCKAGRRCLGLTLGALSLHSDQLSGHPGSGIWKKAHRSLDISQAMMRSSMKQMRNAMSFASVWTVEMKNGWDPLAFFLPMRQRVCVWITILPIPASAR